MKPWNLPVSLILGAAAAACVGVSGDRGDPAGAGGAIELTATELELADRSNDFAFGLFAEVNAAHGLDNTFISPLSASMMLGMALNGAVGQTAADIEATLGLDGLTLEEIDAGYRNLREHLAALDPAVAAEISDSIWWADGVAPDPGFLAACAEYFDAETGALSQGAIDAWVAEATHDTIDHVDIDPATYFTLVDALYFKAGWTYRFEETVEEPFRRDDGAEIAVPMMRAELEVGFFSTEEAYGVELPYGDGRFAMTIILPLGAGTADELAASLTREEWDGMRGALHVQVAEVGIPRFELRFRDSLIPYLEALGMEHVFGAGGDFSGIAAGMPGMDGVDQYTYLKVDEQGTEASAVTVGSWGMSMGSDGFRADRPFLFVIHELESGAILFMGKLSDPTA